MANIIALWSAAATVKRLRSGLKVTHAVFRDDFGEPDRSHVAGDV